jgi:hypothetical protein
MQSGRHLAEFGIVAPVGRHGVEELLNVVGDPSDKRVPEMARACLSALGALLRTSEPFSFIGGPPFGPGSTLEGRGPARIEINRGVLPISIV